MFKALCFVKGVFMKKIFALIALTIMLIACLAIAGCDSTNTDTAYKPATKGLKFYPLNDKECVVAVGDALYLEEIVIPKKHNGLTVVKIADEGFADCKNLKSITIPDSVTSIGYSAFYGCISLTSITLPFIGATTDGSVDDDTSFGYIFGGNSYIPKTLKTVVITGGIGSGAFSGCSGLTSITISNSVTSIGSSAFAGCSGLTSITIPNSVTTIGDYAFYGCSGLMNITVDKNNSNYQSIDGNLYSKDGTVLLQYAIGKTETSFTIPNSVTSISDGAFSGCNGLTSVTIPNSVTNVGESAFYGCSGLASITLPFIGATSDGSINTSFGYIFGGNFNIPATLKTVVITGSSSIGDYAFEYCRSLTEIVIPDSVTSIGDYAFSGCSALTTVYYTGTQEQWENIFISIFNNALKKATIVYNYTQE